MVRILSHLQFYQESDLEALERKRQEELQQKMEYQHAEASAMSGSAEADGSEGEEPAQPFVREGEKIGRNDPCPCGSGKKYKRCHGALSNAN